MSQKIIVLGAGVIGLTIAHHLSEDTSASYDIEVVARELPTQDDMNSQMWATPWAVSFYAGCLLVIYASCFARGQTGRP